MDERDEIADRIGQRVGRDLRPALNQERRQLRTRPGSFGKECASGRQDLGQVHAANVPPEHARSAPSLEDGLDERPQVEGIARADEVDRRPHQRGPNGLALDDRVR